MDVCGEYMKYMKKMNELPVDIVYEIAERLEYPHSFVQLRKDWEKVRHWHVRTVDTSKMYQKDRQHVEKFIKELRNIKAPVETLIIRPNKDDGFLEGNVFVDLLEDGNEDCIWLLRAVGSIVTDSKLWSTWKNHMGKLKVYDSAHVIIRKCHHHDVSLDGLRAHKLIIQNKRYLHTEYPDIDSPIWAPLSEEDMSCNVIHDICQDVKELECIGSVELAGLPRKLCRLSMDGCILSHPLPATVHALELRNVRVECNDVMDDCRELEHLELENMFGFSRRIPESVWIAWGKTLKTYVDASSLAYQLHCTKYLHSLEHFEYHPGNMHHGRAFHDIAIPQSKNLQNIILERTLLTENSMEYVLDCPHVILENCSIPQQYHMLPPHVVVL